MVAELRLTALECVASGVMSDCMISAKWMEFFEQHDPPFAERLRSLLGASRQTIFTEISRELVAGELPRPYPAIPGIREMA
jgi:hypothetical protein